MVEKLRRVPLREVWAHETDLTRWLSMNPDVLSDALGLTLSSPRVEKPAGDFSVDLVAEDDNGDAVVIEAQFGRSDHDHLGKLLTYLTSLDARTAVWIVPDPRPEHVGVLTWLNETSAADFYLLKAEAVQIGTSAPAPLLTMVVGPSLESRQVGKRKVEFAEDKQVRERFWTRLLDRARERKLHLFSGSSPSKQGWMSTASGVRGLYWGFYAYDDRVSVELYIDRGNAEENKRIFDELYASKAEIEKQLGVELDWQRLETSRASRIKWWIRDGGLSTEEGWTSLHETMITTLTKLEGVLRGRIQNIGR